MTGQPATRLPLLWILLVILIGAYAFWLSTQVDETQDLLADAQQREQALVGQLQMLAAQSAPAVTTMDAQTEALAIALLRRPDLIPFEGVLGGTFYYLEDTLRPLTDRYLYVTVEDGHIQGHLLMEYTETADGYAFEVLDGYLD
jgi:hypothetical protein